jgi:hypothetical protein
MYSKDPKKNKGIPTLRETRFATTDNRYLEGEGEEEYLASQTIADEEEGLVKQTMAEEADQRKNFKLSYESDGIMGEEEKGSDQVDREAREEDRPKDFFNTTQSSE